MPLVKFYANLRKLASVKEKVVPGNSIRAVLETLADDFPGLRPFFFDGNRIQVRVIITLNGQTLDPETVPDIPVSEQDQIAIFPPISGG